MVSLAKVELTPQTRSRFAINPPFPGEEVLLPLMNRGEISRIYARGLWCSCVSPVLDARGLHFFHLISVTREVGNAC
jgi:hypothetical protein